MEDFKPTTWAQPVQDIVKEYEQKDAEECAAPEIPTEPEEFSKSMVRRGVINSETGAYNTTSSSKQGKILEGNIRGYSEQGKMNYERTFGHS